MDPRPLPWYAEEKREQGAYATFLGVGFACSRRGAEERAGGDWCTLAVGDSCLFRLRAGKLRQSFPLSRSSDFGNQPALLGSRGRRIDTPAQDFRRARGHWRPGERFLLVIDALAEWMLRQIEQEQRPDADLDRLLAESNPQAAFAGWVAERRERQGLRNDDVTVVIVDL